MNRYKMLRGWHALNVGTLYKAKIIQHIGRWAALDEVIHMRKRIQQIFISVVQCLVPGCRSKGSLQGATTIKWPSSWHYVYGYGAEMFDTFSNFGKKLTHYVVLQQQLSYFAQCSQWSSPCLPVSPSRGVFMGEGRWIGPDPPWSQKQGDEFC